MSQHVIISIIISLIILVDKTVLIPNSELTTSVIKYTSSGGSQGREGKGKNGGKEKDKV